MWHSDILQDILFSIYFELDILRNLFWAVINTKIYRILIHGNFTIGQGLWQKIPSL